MFLYNNFINLALIKQLDASSLRQKIIANNIANINTPQFKKSRVSFEENLKKAISSKNIDLRKSHSSHITITPKLSQIKPEVLEVKNTRMRGKGNNVDLEQEMVNLSRNALTYQTIGQVLNGRISTLEHVINGGR